MKELVILSGKGGTGKTSVTAAFAQLATSAVMADCDVDAADLHLVLQPDVQSEQIFKSGHEAIIRAEDCTGCGLCETLCRFGAIRNGAVDPLACEGCGVCVEFCPQKAIDFPEAVCGVWYVSETRNGPMVHARLEPAAENSGKLVSLVRQEARRVATERGVAWILVDGPPGIGCPVIASMTSATAVLVVTEPTLSGEHDMRRVLELANHFKMPALICINKWDINLEMTERIEATAQALGAKPIGRIPYDPAVTTAQVNGRTVLEEPESPAAKEIEKIWNQLKKEYV